MSDKVNPIAIGVIILLSLTLIYELLCEECYKNEYSEYLKSSHSGMIRGIISGCLLGGFSLAPAIHQGAMFGILNPLMIHMGY